MEIRALQYFLAVAREENMTEAANLLHVTQPTLSRQIADLEAELGKRLFVRTNRNTILTEEGMHLRQKAVNRNGIGNSRLYEKGGITDQIKTADYMQILLREAAL